MTFDLQDSPHETTDHITAEAGESEQKSGFRLDLMIEDSESIAAIVAYLALTHLANRHIDECAALAREMRTALGQDTDSPATSGLR